MKIELQCIHAQAPEGIEALFGQLAAACQREEGLKGKFQALVLIVDEETIRQTNVDQRGKDAVTDVLSFPEVEFARGTARHYPRRLRQALDPDTGHIHLGDIMICLAQAQRQAREYGHSLQREMGYLLVHGLCHLMGYDHENTEEKQAMRQMEEGILAACGMERMDEDRALIALAWQALKQAYAPYSRYGVGACLLAEDGRMFLGCNVENASYGLSMCAERNALFHAVAEGARKFTAIAVVSKGSLPFPCGACRQALTEFAPDLRVLVANGEETISTNLRALLPHRFGPDALDASSKCTEEL